MTQTVGGITSLQVSTPTISTSAYASGDAIGGLQSIGAVDGRTDSKSGIIQSITIADKAKQSAVIDIVFFNANPSATTVTDNGALTVADADLLKVVGYAQVTSYASFADNSVGCASNVALPYNVNNNQGKLYFIAVSRGTPTYAATTDIQISIGLLQD